MRGSDAQQLQINNLSRCQNENACVALRTLTFESGRTNRRKQKKMAAPQLTCIVKFTSHSRLCATDFRGCLN